MMNTTIHPLRRWLFEHQMTAAAFARSAGISKAHLSDVLSGKTDPSLGIVGKIAAATEGEVTANDCLAHHERVRECREKVA